MNLLTNGVGKLHHSLEKLSPYTTTFRTIVNFKLNQLALLLFLESQGVPPLLKGIDDEVTGFIGAAKANVQLPTIFVDNAARNIFFFAAHIMVIGFGIPSRLAATGIIANLDSRFGVQAQAPDSA